MLVYNDILALESRLAYYDQKQASNFLNKRVENETPMSDTAGGRTRLPAAKEAVWL